MRIYIGLQIFIKKTN